MAKKGPKGKSAGKAIAPKSETPAARARPSALLDCRVVYCGDNLKQLAKLPHKCVDLIYIDPDPVSEVELPFNSNRNYEVFSGASKLWK